MLYELTFNDIIKKNAKESGENFAVITPNEKITYSSFDKKIDIVATNLILKGLKENEHVAIWGENSVEWLISFFAVIKAGGIAVLFNYNLPIEDIKNLIKETHIALLIYGENKITRSDENTFNLIKTSLKLRLGAISMKEIENEEKEDKEGKTEKIIFPSRNCHDTSFIIFSTGTTATPKAIMLHQFGIINHCYKCIKILGNVFDEGVCSALPFFHSFGLLMSIISLVKAQTIYTLGQFIPSNILSLISNYKIKTFSSVSTLYYKLAEEADFKTKVAPLIRYGIIGGGTTSPMQFMRLEANFRYARLINGYGMTECSPVISLSKFSDTLEIRSTTVGKPMEETQVRIYDNERGFLEDNQVGEIVVKGYSVMNGYYNMPKEKQPFDKDGWLHTGDLGKITSDGNIELAGRIKDLIIKGGENINPSEIEKEIINFEDVTNVKVLGAKHIVWGESIEACILTKNHNLDIPKLRQTIKEKVGSFKVPSNFFLFDDFPLNANGKLDIKSLQAKMLNRLLIKNADEKLSSGILVIETEITNTIYMISPIASMIENLASYMKFSEKKLKNIRVAIEEMLTERILCAYNNAIGKIKIQVYLMNEWMRICFKDEGSPFDIEKRDREDFSAILLLNAVDNYSFDYVGGHNIYSLDFTYNSDFDIHKFIVSNDKAFLN